MADVKPETKHGAKSAEPAPQVGDHGWTPERMEQDPPEGRGEEEAAAAAQKADKR